MSSAESNVVEGGESESTPLASEGPDVPEVMEQVLNEAVDQGDLHLTVDQSAQLQQGVSNLPETPMGLASSEDAINQSESPNDTPFVGGNEETSVQGSVDLNDLNSSWASQVDEDVEKRELEDKIRNLTLQMESTEANHVKERKKFELGRKEQEARIKRLERLFEAQEMKKESGERDSKEGFEPSEQVPHLLARESEPVGENVKFEKQPSSLEDNITTRPKKSLLRSGDVSTYPGRGDKEQRLNRGQPLTADKSVNLRTLKKSRRSDIYKLEQELEEKTTLLGNKQGRSQILINHDVLPHPVLEGASCTDILSWYDKAQIYKKQIEAEGSMHTPNLVPYMCEFAQLLIVGHCGLDFLQELTTDHVVEYVAFLETEIYASSGNDEILLKALSQVVFPIHFDSMRTAAFIFKAKVLQVMKDRHGEDPSYYNGHNLEMNKLITKNLRKALKNQAVLASRVWEKELVNKGYLLKNVEDFLDAFTVYAATHDRYDKATHRGLYSDYPPKKSDFKRPDENGKATADVKRTQEADSKSEKQPKTQKNPCRNCGAKDHFFALWNHDSKKVTRNSQCKKKETSEFLATEIKSLTDYMMRNKK